MADDTWAIVYPGDAFPKGAVRALGRGLSCQDNQFCDVYVAMWVRDGGEAVFGKCWNNGGKAEATFPWGGKEVRGDETKGYRVLTYIGPQSEHKYKYRWCRAYKTQSNNLLSISQYTPAVIHCQNGEECLGKASWDSRMAWSGRAGAEQVHEGVEFDNCHLLCRFKTEQHDDD